MTSLKEFLEDTQIAIDNGFGKKETILRMFNALYATMELHSPDHPYSIPSDLKCKACSGLDFADYPCETIRTIEAELG